MKAKIRVNGTVKYEPYFRLNVINAYGNPVRFIFVSCGKQYENPYKKYCYTKNDSFEAKLVIIFGSVVQTQCLFLCSC